MYNIEILLDYPELFKKAIKIGCIDINDYIYDIINTFSVDEMREFDIMFSQGSIKEMYEEYPDILCEYALFFDFGNLKLQESCYDLLDYLYRDININDYAEHIDLDYLASTVDDLDDEDRERLINYIDSSVDDENRGILLNVIE